MAIDSHRGPRRFMVTDELVIEALRKVYGKPDLVFVVKAGCRKCFERGYTAFRLTPQGRRVVPCRCLLVGKKAKVEDGGSNDEVREDESREKGCPRGLHNMGDGDAGR